MTTFGIDITGILTACATLLATQDTPKLPHAQLAEALSTDLPTLPTLPPHRLRNNGKPLIPLKWDDIDDKRCWEWTRFSKLNIEYFVIILGIPDPFYTKKRNKIPGNLALTILLNRLSYPNRLCDLEWRYGIAATTLSTVINQLSEFVFDYWAEPLLTGFNSKLLTAGQLDSYASAIHSRGAPMNNIFGFMDVTFNCVSRPKEGQEASYSGYKKRHANKHNAIATPDGLIVHCSLPVEGRCADSTVLAYSKLEPLMEEHAFGAGKRRLFVYADPAYGVSNTIVSAAKEVQDLKPEEQEFYTALSRCRMCVEWGFGKVFNYFAFLDYDKNMRLYGSPVRRYFILAVFFTNLHTCLYGSVTSHTFKLAPPSLEEYLLTALG
ncbi:DDE superfamily endonuclease [Ceratobasidium sp. AG-Ba]|nr:DDE superfamily endonuclease [Ceratobasidium sp. AG-Ba]